MTIKNNILIKRKWYQNPMTQSYNEKLEKAKEISNDEVAQVCLAGLLEAKGLFSDADKEAHLYPQQVELFDPFLFKDMLLACEIIAESIKSKEKIVIFGDYDCDGLTATSILVRVLRTLEANVDYLIPDRIKDGYGLGESTVQRIIDLKPNLIVTVDCGINNHKEINQLMSAGIKVIISDHHQPDSEDLSQVLAVLNPQVPEENYPFASLSGAGVAFKIAQALVKYYDKEQEIDLSAELCLAAVGTVADSMPLESENRVLVALATAVFLEKAPLGLRLLATKLNNSSKVDASFFAFSIGPRLNAAGRMSQIEPAISLLLSNDDSEITQLLIELEDLNEQRKLLEQQIYGEAIEQIEQMPPQEKKYIIIVADENWHIGVTGIVSSRLVDKYSVPVITFAGSKEGLKGSARSIGDFDILSAIESASEYTVVYGGHIQAAGVTLNKDHYQKFKQQLIDYAMANPVKKFDLNAYQYQFVLSHSTINEKFAKQLTRLEPYGQKNEKPNFVINKVKIEYWRVVGQGKHASLTLRLADDRLVSGIAFNAQDFSRLFREGDFVDLLVNVEWQEWNNRNYIQLKILDWRIPSSSNLLWQDYARIEETYQINEFDVDSLIKMYGLDGKQFEVNNIQIAAITHYLQKYTPELEVGFDLALLARAIARELKIIVNPFILTRILAMLKEIDLVECTPIDKSNFSLRIKKQAGARRNIQDAPTWQTLNKQELIINA